MAKLSDKLKAAFKNFDTKLGAVVEGKSKASAIGPSQGQYKAYKAGQNIKGLLTGKLPKAATKVGKLGKLGTVARVASRVALPVAAGFEAANVAYKVATMSPEKKAKVKKLKTKLKKTSTKDYHADLLKMSTGGDTMLKGGQKKLDKNKDGKISGEDFKLMKKNMGGEMKKPMKAALGAAALLGVGGSKLKDKMKDMLKKKASVVSPAMQYLGDTAKKSKGGEMKQGYGAARTSGMGLQDEDLIPGKSMDYYKDVM